MVKKEKYNKSGLPIMTNPIYYICDSLLSKLLRYLGKKRHKPVKVLLKEKIANEDCS